MEPITYIAVLICICVQLLHTIVSLDVKIATILPEDPQRMFSTKRIAPAIQFAIEHLQNHTEYITDHNINITVKYRDSKCSSAHGINHAINFYMRKEVDVFFGPVCDFSVAPVARQVLFWNLPLISVGAMARDFTTHREEYRMLSRIGPVNFDKLASAFINILRYHNWNKFKIIYDKEGQGHVMDSFCHLAASGMYYGIQSRAANVSLDYYNYGTTQDPHWPTEVGLEYGGQNKNKYVMGYLSWRVMTGRHQTIEYLMQIPDHGRCLVDSGFASLKKLYRRTDCDSLEQLEQVVNKSSTTNEAIRYPAWQWRDWKSFLEPVVRPVPGIRKYQYFRVTSESSGVAFVKTDRDSDEMSFRTIRAGVHFTRDELPDIIPASGLSRQRQEYLFKTVRPLVRPSHQHSLCPPVQDQ